MLKFAANRNDSLISWAVFPAASTDSISNTTAAVSLRF